MSYNLVDPTTGDLTRVAGNSNIVDTTIKTDSTWSSKKINDSLVNIADKLEEKIDKDLANATGTLAVANGGTGATTANAAANAFINSLTTGTDIPKDEDYYVCQWAGGNSETPVNTAYTRRPISKLWNYIKDKISSVLGLTATQYNGNANTATNADYSKNMYSQTFDLSSLDKTKFYPLVSYTGSNFAEVAICSEGGLGSTEYNQNRIHFDISTTGWDDTPFTLNIREYACFENNEVTIGCIGRGVRDGAWAIWLRGGVHYTCFSRGCDLSLKTSDYTYGNETYTVGTNYYGGSNSNVNIEFTPQSTITSGAYSNRAITASSFIGNVSGSSGSGMVHACQTNSTTVAKTISIPGFTLTQGVCIRVKFLYGNQAKFPTLNVNDTGAHQILGSRGSLQTLIESASDISVQSGLGVCSWDTGIVLDLYFDGTSWEIIGDPIVKKFYDGTNALHKNVSLIGNVQVSILY